jgi:hypothetical protein
MGVPTSEVGYTSATTGRGDHEVHKGHVVALEKKSSEHANRAYSGLDQSCLLGHVSLTYVNVRRFSGDKAAFPGLVKTECEGGINRRNVGIVFTG